MSSSWAEACVEHGHGRSTDPITLSDDTVADESAVPRHLRRERSRWLEKYDDELALLFDAYLDMGSTMFGRAFHQHGSFREFANFVFKYMQPGAT
jgi:hypothetical protein|tara:strand:- start:1794 stop:2078 length:285 start_codon:yes stop_codon:yes gene_type:complete